MPILSKFRATPAMAVSVVALVIAMGGTSVAVSSYLLAGLKNKVSATTLLVGSVKGRVLYLANTRAGAPALSLVVKGGPPLTVNSTDKVKNLNGDYLDGLDSSAFRRTSDPVDAATLDGFEGNAFLRLVAMASDEVSGEPLLTGTTNALAPAFTPLVSGRCHVMVSAQIFGPNAAGYGPRLRIAVQRAANPAQNDTMTGASFGLLDNGSFTEVATRSGVFDVTAGEPTRFGANLSTTSGAWGTGTSHTANVQLSYFCVAGAAPV